MPALRKKLEQNLSLDLRRRIEALLDRISQAAAQPEPVRAILVLEQCGTSQSRRLLGGLASGFAGARLTREAKSALDRLDRRALK